MDDYYGYGGLSGGALVALMLLYTVVPLLAYALYSWFYMKIFEKAGVQGKWRAWVPVYSSMIFYKLGDFSPWLLLYLLGAGVVGTIIPFLGWFIILPIVGIAARIVDLVVAWRVGLKLQKDAVWVVLYFFLPPVWLGINAFDSSRWNPGIQPASWSSNSLLGDRTVWQGVPVQPSATAAPQGYGAAPQGYAPPAPQGYAPPAPQGYAPPAQPGYAPPTQPGYAPPAGPAAPATGAPAVPPVAPTTPPAAPTTPPAPPTAPPAAPPAPPADPAQPPA